MTTPTPPSLPTADPTIPARDEGSLGLSINRGRIFLEALRAVGIEAGGRRVADLGAGFGPISLAAAEAGADVIAIDAAPERLSRLERDASAADVQLRTIRANLLDPLPIQGERDLAFLVGVVEYAGLWDRQTSPNLLQARIFRHALASLTPGGTLVFASKNLLWPRFVVRDAHYGAPLLDILPLRAAEVLARRILQRDYRHRIHTPFGWKRMVRQAGFTDVEGYVPFGSYQFPAHIARAPSWHDLSIVRSRRRTDPVVRANLGGLWVLKAMASIAPAAVGLHVAHGIVVIARKP
jgi:SAM-dependent methyltransferase